ncbi:MAG: PorT family protein, partial [Bacteroidales bacterium]|nr:PorT family protein [Bacteroidales bacterium]
MNRIILVIMFFVSFNEVYAQKKMQSSSPHEFSVHGGFGLSALQYQIKEGDNKSGIGGSVGIGYSYMFSPQWGLNTGVEISFYNAQCDMNVLTGEHPVTGIEESFIFKTSYTDYNETQNASYLNIPVMILFKTQTSTVFYGSAGAKLGFPINSKYK